MPVVVVFDSGNLKSVVEAIHEKYPKIKIAISLHGLFKQPLVIYKRNGGAGHT